MIGGLNWRYVYFLSLGLKFYFALSDSYIHPDEHFQNFSVLTGMYRFLHFSTYIPWEFTAEHPARSFAPLLAVYGPILTVVSYFNTDVTPQVLLYLFRLQFCLMSWIVTDWCIHRLLPSKPERVKALLFVSTSYVTLTYQNHTFSNSIETLVLMPCLVIINQLREAMEINTSKETNKHRKLFTLGCLIAFGTFTRITFPGFLILPLYYVFQHFRIHRLSVSSCALGFGLTSFLAILIDTHAFQSTSYVIAPFNNLLYNLDYTNLSNHGIHPRYTHVFVNLPQILGPGLVFLVYRNGYRKTTPFLALLSGVLCLSVFPHQELRFLVPLLPLACCCFDLRPYPATTVKYLLYAWYAFNALMSVLMGVYHQGGVIPVLAHLREENFTGVQIWWRTYSPPEWILGSKSMTILKPESLQGLQALDTGADVLVDLMGAGIEEVNAVLSIAKERFGSVLLVTPVASYNTNTFSVALDPSWTYAYHLDMDHLDFGDWKSLSPGICIYNLI
ncbi:glycosyltransferase family 22 protein [Babjeviella inositovora NRRL Y-12698]|uniref:Mannosyltransferase n=1 Tax=Babjeviella inositovora NRRL Y-12698 TaxID=984486 RepID=A0A1E3QX65_9ASCO|nr:glycosyltransferase family 22 protein [Babjeviella inositovora NRRL Y-12698]ODQ81597.1 glycosyltransferase family 22 protein [Babjeviella inositovora NRRL Y-12698]